MYDKDEEKNKAAKLLMEEVMKMFSDSSVIAPSYAHWPKFQCYIEVHTPEELKWYSLFVANA